MDSKFYQTNIPVRVYPNGTIKVKSPEGWTTVTYAEAISVINSFLIKELVNNHFKD